MAITFAYTQATNTVVVTEGTAETPATFSGFVTADRAGTLTLLDAGVIDADPDTFSLDDQPRPCERGLIEVLITTSADRAGATLEIVGKDYDSDAIGETIDISTANATPVTSVLKYNTIDASGITVNGMTNDDTVTITQGQWGVIWDKGNGQYQCNANFTIGNASTSTYFRSTIEHFILTTGLEVTVTNSATLTLGRKQGDYALQGSSWVLTSGSEIIKSGNCYELGFVANTRISNRCWWHTHYKRFVYSQLKHF